MRPEKEKESRNTKHIVKEQKDSQARRFLISKYGKEYTDAINYFFFLFPKRNTTIIDDNDEYETIKDFEIFLRSKPKYSLGGQLNKKYSLKDLFK